MTTGRNDPCPCGSGKKFKKCCMDLSGKKSEVIPGKVWQAELIPINVRIESDPNARCGGVFFLFYTGQVEVGSFMLRPPSEPSQVAQVIQRAVIEIAGKHDAWPESIIVRHRSVADTLRVLLADRNIAVSVSELPALLEAAAKMADDMSGTPFLMGHSPVWSGWELGEEMTRKLIHSAADYYRAAPWRSVRDLDLLRMITPEKRVWHLCVMGNAGTFYGLNLYEQESDYDRFRSGTPYIEACHNLKGEVIWLGFSKPDNQKTPMVQEFKENKYELADPKAYPQVQTLNTLAGAFTTIHATDLMRALQVLPRLHDVLKVDADRVAGWHDSDTGVIIQSRDHAIALGIVKKPQCRNKSGRKTTPRVRTSSVRKTQPSKSRSVFQIKVTLLDSDPLIWRQLLLRSEITLAKLHWVIQKAMGWSESHLHLFELGDSRRGKGHFPVYSEPAFELEEDWGTPVGDESKVRVNEILRKEGEKLFYQYDFGDDWRHEIKLEKILPADTPIGTPRSVAKCLAGARACPPEDVGGVHGYADYLAAIADPVHEEHDAMLEWRGEIYPEIFDLRTVNRRLRAK